MKNPSRKKNHSNKFIELISFINKPAVQPLDENPTGSYLFVFGTTIIFFFFINLLISMLIFIVGGQIGVINFYLSVVFTLAFCYFLSRIFFRKSAIKTALLIITILGIVFYGLINLSGSFYDISYDGQSYHQEGIIRLKEGWNPVYKQFTEKDLLYPKLLNNYSKGPWIVAASLYKITNNIEMSKVFNWMFILASFALTLWILLSFKWLNSIVSILISLLVAFNPVSIYQSLSFYVDGQLSSLIICLVVALIGVFLSKKGSLLALFLIIPVLMNVKLTAIAYVIVISTFGFAIMFNQAKRVLGWKTLIVFFLSSIFGFFIIGFSPFITNSLTKSNPFYPVLGSGALDYRSTNMPENFLDKDPRGVMLLSIFSKSDTAKGTGKFATSKIPFQILAGEDEPFKYPDASVGGFGPLFGGALVLSVLGFGLGFIFRKKAALKYAFIIGLVLIVSVAVNPTSSLARFVPQLWIIPLALAVMIFSYNKILSNILGIVLLLVLVLNNLFIADNYFGYNLVTTSTVRQQMLDLSKEAINKTIEVDFGDHGSTRIKLDKYKVMYSTKQGNLSCEAPRRILVENVTLACI
jgi:hypothetical protein